MKDNIILLQEMLMEEMKRVMELDVKNGLAKREIERSKAISGNATNYIKAISTNLKIKEYADKTRLSENKIKSELGLLMEDGEN